MKWEWPASAPLLLGRGRWRGRFGNASEVGRQKGVLQGVDSALDLQIGGTAPDGKERFQVGRRGEGAGKFGALECGGDAEAGVNSLAARWLAWSGWGEFAKGPTALHTCAQIDGELPVADCQPGLDAGRRNVGE